MGREVYSRQVLSSQSSQPNSERSNVPVALNPVDGTSMVNIRRTPVSQPSSLNPQQLGDPSFARASRRQVERAQFERTQSQRSVPGRQAWPFPPRQNAEERMQPYLDTHTFLVGRMPLLFQLDSEFTLTDQQAFNFLEEHNYFQSIVTNIKIRIHTFIVNELPLTPSEAEEVFVVICALRDLEDFMSAAALRQAFSGSIMTYRDGGNWQVSGKPEAAMYPFLRNEELKDQLRGILRCADTISNAI